MAGGWMDKIKDIVKGNPQRADSAVDKLENMVDERTGGKYAEHVDKGGDALRGQLGIPTEEATAPAPPNEPAEPQGQQPSPTEPQSQGGGAAESGSAPNPMPGTDDPQETTTGDGPLTPGEPQRPGEPGGPVDPGDLPGQAEQPGQASPLPEGGPTQQGEPDAETPTPGTTETDPGQPGEPTQGGPPQIPTDEPASTSQLPGGRDRADPGELPGDTGSPGADKELPPFGNR